MLLQAGSPNLLHALLYEPIHHSISLPKIYCWQVRVLVVLTFIALYFYSVTSFQVSPTISRFIFVSFSSHFFTAQARN
jgi:hypothetical protein